MRLFHRLGRREEGNQQGQTPGKAEHSVPASYYEEVLPVRGKAATGIVGEACESITM